MASYILRRLLLILPTLLIIVLINFGIVQLAPSGPVEQAIYRAENMQALVAGQQGIATRRAEIQSHAARGLSPEMIAQIEKQYGFDQPAHRRLLKLINSYLHFDFGQSFFKDKAVTTLIWEKLPVSLSLGLWSSLLLYLLAIPLGIQKARKHGQAFDRISSMMLALSYALPSFVIALLLLLFFAGGSYWQWFPLQGLVSDDFASLGWLAKIKDYLWHITLPVISITVVGIARLSFLSKSAFIEELHKPYVLAARARGVSSNQLLYRQVFANAILPVLASLPEVLISIFLFGNLLIEIMFNLDGLGLLAFEAVSQRDYPVIFASVFIFSLLGMLLRLLSDLLYHWVDPRIDFVNQGRL